MRTRQSMLAILGLAAASFASACRAATSGAAPSSGRFAGSRVGIHRQARLPARFARIHAGYRISRRRAVREGPVSTASPRCGKWSWRLERCSSRCAVPPDYFGEGITTWGQTIRPAHVAIAGRLRLRPQHVQAASHIQIHRRGMGINAQRHGADHERRQRVARDSSIRRR
mgnify:CR=1 FL=1